ncbi:MAG: hypothetical protein ACJAVV_000129 [Alphaproteobacteria bacterium]
MFSVSSQAAVEVTINNTNYVYSTNPRLADVLNQAALKEEWYWPESKLFRSNTTKSQNTRKQIIEMLAIESDGNNQYKSIYQSVINQIKSWEVADRITLLIDFELARVSTRHNPRLENGQYKILLSKRPENIYVFGAMANASNLPYANNTCIKDIVSKITFSALANKSHVYIISSQGKIEQTPVAYWNSQCNLLMPGAMIYVPFQNTLFSNQHSVINTKIAELAVNRITVQ